MNVTIRFSHPLYLATYSGVLLLIGWTIGARWGHTVTAGRALVWAIIALLIHYIAMAVLAAIGGYKFAEHLRNRNGR
jgi:hypothetical protein